MPVMVAEKDRDRWLGGEDVSDLLGLCPAEQMEMWPSQYDGERGGDGGGAVVWKLGMSGRARWLFRSGDNDRTWVVRAWN